MSNVNGEKVVLTERQKQVVDLLRQGSTASEVAQQLKLNSGTVSNHVKALKVKGVLSVVDGKVKVVLPNNKLKVVKKIAVV